MNTAATDFKKTKEFLLCVDSDGCAMDTMDIKHKACFGPQFIRFYGLQSHAEHVQQVWDKINLYSHTRGINRFKAVVLTLQQLQEEGLYSESFDDLLQWTDTADELSGPALQKEIDRTHSTQLICARDWSAAVNRDIKALPKEHGTFGKVLESLKALHEVADIAVVSSANSTALLDEWTRCGLSPFVGALLGQENGSKATCIRQLKQGRYAPDKVLMVGDAPGDYKAAKENGVFFYPILVDKEEESWIRLVNEAFSRLQSGTFAGAYQQKLLDDFHSVLK